MAEQGRILIVDDEPEQVMLLSEVLKGMGYAIRGVTDGREALDVLRREPFDLLITDIKMPEVDGMEVVDHAARLAHPPEVILITGYPSLDTAQLAIERGVHDYLIKPLNYAELGVKVRKALAGRRLSRENLMLREIASIHEATRKLTLARNLDDLLDLIMDECFATARAESGSIMLAMEGEPGLVVRLVRGRRDERVMKVGTRLTEGIACQVAVRGEPVLIRGREILPDIGFRPKPDWELGSSISLPLKAEERILGVVNLNRSVAASPFDQIDLNVASVMAMQAGVSIENAILKDRLQGKIGELEAANRRAEEAYRELLQAEKLSAIGLMAGTVAHDINNPLSVIDGRAQILLYKLGAESEVGQSLSAMKVQIDRIANLVRGLRNYAR
jgi:CheY-like chemotaxis protein